MKTSHLKVFIECEAGTRQKRWYDEKTLECKRSIEVSAPYPYPYGFILDTTGEDGDGLDCFVITGQALLAGQVVICEPVGMMEQFEGDEIDHKILARLDGDETEIDLAIQETLADFVYRLFAEHMEEYPVRVGRFLGREQALAQIAACRDRQI